MVIWRFELILCMVSLVIPDRFDFSNEIAKIFSNVSSISNGNRSDPLLKYLNFVFSSIIFGWKDKRIDSAPLLFVSFFFLIMSRKFYKRQLTCWNVSSQQKEHSNIHYRPLHKHLLTGSLSQIRICFLFMNMLKNILLRYFPNKIYHKNNEKTRKSSCVETRETYRPCCILSMACPARGRGVGGTPSWSWLGGGGVRGYPVLVLAKGWGTLSWYCLGGGRHLYPKTWLGYSLPLPSPNQDQDRIPPPQKGPGTRDQGYPLPPPEKNLGPVIWVPSPPCGQTHTCENSTFPILRMRAEIMAQGTVTLDSCQCKGLRFIGIFCERSYVYVLNTLNSFSYRKDELI